MLTRSGVCYDLRNSPYTLEIGSHEFMFSSASHLDKFLSEREAFARKINASLSNRFGMAFNMSQLSDILLYKKIESRGFFITVEGAEYKCLDNLQLNGQIGKSSNYNVTFDVLTQKLAERRQSTLSLLPSSPQD